MNKVKKCICNDCVDFAAQEVKSLFVLVKHLLHLTTTDEKKPAPEGPAFLVGLVSGASPDISIRT